MNWDTLHLRFASSVRDSVSAANLDGLELKVVDRDAYLNYAYTQYIRLLAIYNPDALDNIVPELFKTANLTAASSIINYPVDFGYFIDLRQSGTVLTKLHARDYLRIKDNPQIQDPPSAVNVYYTLSIGSVLLLPSGINTAFDFSYIVYQPNIVQGGVTDIAIGPEHWDTIIALAKVQYYSDKQEFDIAQAFRGDAILNSPYKIGVKPNA